jgi:hypothetical protein
MLVFDDLGMRMQILNILCPRDLAIEPSFRTSVHPVNLFRQVGYISISTKSNGMKVYTLSNALV